jgi:UPF0042 nucleotide-binding protein
MTMRFVVITWPSGAGKTLALHSFEDAGYYTVDNLPPSLLPALAAFCREEGWDRAAVVIDTRCGPAFAQLPAILGEMSKTDTHIETLFLDAGDDALVKRFKETRRPHPLLRESEDSLLQEGIVEAIHAERALLQPARALVDHIFDTSALNGIQLRDAIHATYAQDTRPGLLVTITSFGFKHGLPIDADLVFDVRFLANPHYVPALTKLDGRDARVARYVHEDPRTGTFQEKMEDLVRFALPQYAQEGKAYLNIAIGCTGGQHRSVVLSENLAATLRQEGYRVALRHRDIREETSASSSDTDFEESGDRQGDMETRTAESDGSGSGRPNRPPERSAVLRSTSETPR